MKNHFQFHHLSRPLFFIGFLVLAAFLVLWNAVLTHTMIEYLNMNDFGKFYFAIQSFFENDSLYEPNRATLINVSPLFAQQFWNLNPPHFYFLIMPLGYFSPHTALAIWGMISLATLIVCLQMIGKEVNFTPTTQQSRLIFLGILAFSGTGAILITGQITFLLLLPFTLAWLQVRKERWTKAAITLGLACSIKPFLLIFSPYFLLKQKYKPFLLFILSCSLVFGIGVVTLGTKNYSQWFKTLGLIDWSWASMNCSIHGILNRSLQDNPAFSTLIDAPKLITPLWILLSGICGIITFFIIHQDRSFQNFDRSYVLLILAATLISPLGWIYYLFLAVGPLTSITYQWWKNKFSSRPQPFTTLRNSLFLLACVGFIVPFHYPRLLQPHGWATISLGSIFFWCTLSMWMAFILDGYYSKKEQVISPARVTQNESPTTLQREADCQVSCS